MRPTQVSKQFETPHTKGKKPTILDYIPREDGFAVRISLSECEGREYVDLGIVKLDQYGNYKLAAKKKPTVRLSEIDRFVAALLKAKGVARPKTRTSNVATIAPSSSSDRAPIRRSSAFEGARPGSITTNNTPFIPIRVSAKPCSVRVVDGPRAPVRASSTFDAFADTPKVVPAPGKSPDVAPDPETPPWE